MKILIILALCAVSYFELSQGLHLQSLNYRNRREAAKTEDVADKVTELQEFVVNATVALAQDTIESYNRVIGKVLEQAKEAELKGEDVDKFQKLFEKTSENIEKGIVDEKSIVKLLDLFGEVLSLTQEFDELEDPTEVQKSLKKIFDDNNADLLTVKFMLNFLVLRIDLGDKVEEYIDSLSEAQKEKETKIIDWYAKFKKAEGADELIDTTMSFFDLFDDGNESK